MSHKSKTFLASLFFSVSYTGLMSYFGYGNSIFNMLGIMYLSIGTSLYLEKL